jgi:hypothetical protein
MERDTNDPCAPGTYMAKEEWSYTAQDSDCDGVPNDDDICLDDYDPNQSDFDGDGVGDVCDNCPNDPNNDVDADNFCGDVDNCHETFNPRQINTDGDLMGDMCDDDDDNDGVLDPNDSCPLIYNPDDQNDFDDDGFGDVCDGCPEVPNPPGDFDGDCYVNLKDFAPLSVYWLDINCGVVNLWCNRVDYNQDTDITLEEVLFVALNWLDCTDPDPPCSSQP